MCLAVPGKITSIDEKDPLDCRGKVDFGGISKEVSLSCVPEAKVGDYAIVHVGMAISLVDEQEARKMLDDIKEFASPEELRDEMGEPPA